VIVALLTDFGLRDHYVGTMKGVILSVCPQATLVDLTHDIAPQDITAAALELAAAYRYFPAGTVFLVVVDPGVGSPRRGIAVEAGGYRFVGPDNGVLSLAWSDAGAPVHVVELRNTALARAQISKTFEGRDRFAPAAGYLARGLDLGEFGPRVDDAVTLDVPEPTVIDAAIVGEVIRVDRFGNLITNIPRSLIESWSDSVCVIVANHQIPRLGATYAEAPSGELCALIGSTGQLEVAVNGGSAAATLRASRGARVRVARATEA
jgi:S-adenosylmethionine hydrolase